MNGLIIRLKWIDITHLSALSVMPLYWKTYMSHDQNSRTDRFLHLHHPPLRPHTRRRGLLLRNLIENGSIQGL